MNLNNAAFMPQRVRTAIWRNARWLLRLTAILNHVTGAAATPSLTTSGDGFDALADVGEANKYRAICDPSNS